MVTMVQHHKKYKEIHGVDEIIVMTESDHKKLHNRLRRENKCRIPVAELSKISMAAHKRTEEGKNEGNVYRKKYMKDINFSEAMIPYVGFRERLTYNENTGTVSWHACFEPTDGKRLFYIDCENVRVEGE